MLMVRRHVFWLHLLCWFVSCWCWLLVCWCWCVHNVACTSTDSSITAISQFPPCNPVCVVSSMYLHLFKVNRNMDILSLLILLCRVCLITEARLLALRPEPPLGLLLIVWPGGGPAGAPVASISLLGMDPLLAALPSCWLPLLLLMGDFCATQNEGMSRFWDEKGTLNRQKSKCFLYRISIVDR